MPRAARKAQAAESEVMATHSLTITDWRPPSLNKTLRQHRVARSKSTRMAADLFAVEAYRQGVPKAERRRRVSVHVVLSGAQREYDRDNGWKHLLDVLVKAELLVDDRDRWCELGAVSYSRGEKTRTEIKLEDI